MLKFALALALVAPVAIVAAPAHAADLKTLVCVEQALTAEGKASLLKDIEVNLTNAGGEQNYSTATVTAIQGAAKSCAAKHGWSDKASEAAVLYTVTKLAWPTAVRMGRAKGVNPDALAKRVNALTPAEKANGTSEEVLTKLAEASAVTGELDETNAALAGALYGLLTLKEKAYIDFQKN